jgi:hypothetical protein
MPTGYKDISENNYYNSFSLIQVIDFIIYICMKSLIFFIDLKIGNITIYNI